MASSILRRRAVVSSGDDALSQANIDPELKLPKMSALVTIITSNLLLQMSFFIIVSSSNEYAQHLGGTSTFSGVVIGIPTFISGLALIPMVRYDKGMYKMPMHVTCASAILGHILYALAYRTQFLYLILIGRMVNGLAFTSFMYNKKYCSDARIVGIRRRTTLGSWLVITQGMGMSLGPFAGGLLYKVGFSNRIFNGFTSPGWIMAGIWTIFWIVAPQMYDDPPEETEILELRVPNAPPSASVDPDGSGAVDVSSTELVPAPTQNLHHIMTLSQWGVVVCMVWFAMTCWFVLGSWESNLPVFGASYPAFHWSPFEAGNFIALGGICAFPFLLANLFIARHIEDRILLVSGSALGGAGLVIFMSLLATKSVSYGTLFVAWWSVALGFNLASTVTVSLLSKQLPARWNGRSSLVIQCGTYAGRVTGAIWGGSGVKVGMKSYVGLEMGLLGIGALLFTILWRDLKAKRG